MVVGLIYIGRVKEVVIPRDIRAILWIGWFLAGVGELVKGTTVDLVMYLFVTWLFFTFFR